MATIAEKLKQTASSSGAAAIETKLNDTTRLHCFLLEEMATYSDFLKDRIEKWGTLHTRIKDLKSWIGDTEGRLEKLKGNENLSDVKVRPFVLSSWQCIRKTEKRLLQVQVPLGSC